MNHMIQNVKFLSFSSNLSPTIPNNPHIVQKHEAKNETKNKKAKKEEEEAYLLEQHHNHHTDKQSNQQARGEDSHILGTEPTSL